jgi:Flp pilus assembly protein protease CpaA
MLELALIIAGVILVIGTITDLRTTEVPDWLNFAGIAAGVGLHLIQAIVAWDWHPLLDCALGLVAFVALGFAMYYAGQWGGGDSKMMMALGSIFGLQFSLTDFSISFLINALIWGAIYGVVAVIIIAVRNGKEFSSAFEKNAKTLTFRLMRIGAYVFLFGSVVIALTLMPDTRTKLLVVVLGAIGWSTLWFFMIVRTVEKACMVKQITPDQLMEGDWIVTDVVVAGKRIAGPKDLGITKKQIAELQTLAKHHKILVPVKYGIPFVPSFLLAFVATLLMGNPLLLL